MCKKSKHGCIRWAHKTETNKKLLEGGKKSLRGVKKSFGAELKTKEFERVEKNLEQG